jgi:hypothetical protein
MNVMCSAEHGFRAGVVEDLVDVLSWRGCCLISSYRMATPHEGLQKVGWN